jgi:probable biosynthetic protein (TIGR04098 family)
MRTRTTLDSREIVVSPAMCGPTMLFAAAVGDWTWRTVSEQCGVNAFAARDQKGAPTYLAFYYIRMSGTPGLNPRRLTFGDELTLKSGCFDFGAHSVLTLHRLARAGSEAATVDRLDPAEFYLYPRDDALYIECFNRWITRSRRHSNADLRSSSPLGFSTGHLPRVDDRFSPRWICRDARMRGTFHNPDSQHYALVRADVRVVHPVDVTRDVNGVGLVYFASFFAIADEGVWRLWQTLGRDERDYLDSQLLDHQICYVGNADPGSTIEAEVTLWRSLECPEEEVVNVRLHEGGTGRLLAISTQRIMRCAVPALA